MPDHTENKRQHPSMDYGSFIDHLEKFLDPHADSSAFGLMPVTFDEAAWVDFTQVNYIIEPTLENYSVSDLPQITLNKDEIATIEILEKVADPRDYEYFYERLKATISKAILDAFLYYFSYYAQVVSHDIDDMTIKIKHNYTELTYDFKPLIVRIFDVVPLDCLAGIADIYFSIKKISSVFKDYAFLVSGPSHGGVQARAG